MCFPKIKVFKPRSVKYSCTITREKLGYETEDELYESLNPLRNSIKVIKHKEAKKYRMKEAKKHSKKERK